MRGKPSRGLYTEDELKKHKKGKDHIARELAKQETLNNYDVIKIKPIPSHLDYYGKKEWKRIIPLLQQLPIAELDRELIETYCMLHEVRKRFLKGDSDIKYTEFLSTIKELRMIANQLGMTMNSRLQLAVPDEGKEEDEILKLLKG